MKRLINRSRIYSLSEFEIKKALLRGDEANRKMAGLDNLCPHCRKKIIIWTEHEKVFGYCPWCKIKINMERGK